MSRDEKLIARIKARPPEARYADVERLLYMFGWEADETGSSHVTFKKPGEPPLVVVRKGRRYAATFWTGSASD
jgi:predicted RNA binding protein YcfA (HicA-like mRNA interferase family)